MDLGSAFSVPVFCDVIRKKSECLPRIASLAYLSLPSHRRDSQPVIDDVMGMNTVTKVNTNVP